MKKILIAIFMTALLMNQSNVFAEAININQATLEQLVDNLKGVGAHKAQAIIDYRQQHGNFNSLNDLLKVNGIGATTLEQNKEFMLLK